MKLGRLVAVAAWTLLITLPVTSVSAHVLKQDNSTSAVLHIIPFDAPESNVPTKIELEFSNTAHSFRINDYDIQLTVSTAGKTIDNQAVEAAYLGTQTIGLTTITFPRADVYTLRVTGVPKVATVAGFNFNFDTRVTTGAGATGQARRGTDPVLILAIGVSALILLAMLAVKRISSGGRYAHK